MFGKRKEKILAAICELRDSILNRLTAMENRIMSGVQDLQTAVAGIATDLTAEDAVIAQVIAALQAGNLTDAQAEALAVQLQSSRSNIQASATSLTNALNPPAPPAGS